MYTRGLLDSAVSSQQYCTVSTLIFAVILVKLVKGCIVGLAVRGLDRQEGLFWFGPDSLYFITQVLYVLSPYTHILLLC